jgi:hypothetical protein
MLKRIPLWLWWLVAGLAWLAAAAVAWKLGHMGWAYALGGVEMMAVTFFGGMAVVRLLLRPGWALLGVARTLIDEALRMKVALVFLVALAMTLPVLPFVLDAEKSLAYRLQTYLTWSIIVVSTILGLMTVFLSCYTICNEIAKRQVYLSLTKPVGRGTYLAGKWLGIVLLDGVLLVVSMLAIGTFAKVLATQPARDFGDYLAVNEQVLTARSVVEPTPPGPDAFRQMFEQRADQLRREDPGTYGEKLTQAQANAIAQQVRARWHTLPPLNTREYQFTGLARAKELGPAIQVRLKPNSGKPTPDGRVRLAMQVNGRLWPEASMDGSRPPGLVEIADETFHVMDIPTQFIDEQGQVTLALANVNPLNPRATFDASITFTPGEGLQLLYRVDTFEANLARATVILWLRLCFVAMVGLAAGAFLGFPIAALLTLMVFAAASSSAFVSESLQFYASFSPEPQLTALQTLVAPFKMTYTHLSDGKLFDALKIWVRLIGEAFMALIPALGKYSPDMLIGDGRVVPAALVLEALWKIGVLWTGVVALLGYLIFRRRELARVIV